MDFNRLLKPYREGGTKEKPVERTMGTIADYLINKKRYPPDIVGGAIFMVFMWLDSGGEFEGNDKYGSKGKELVTSIRMKCDELVRKRIESEIYKEFIEAYAVDLKRCITPNWKRKFLKWWKGKDVLA